MVFTGLHLFGEIKMRNNPQQGNLKVIRYIMYDIKGVTNKEFKVGSTVTDGILPLNCSQ